jgi:hypothetical protein
MCANLTGLIGNPIVGEMKKAGLDERDRLRILAGYYAAGSIVIELLRIPG